MWNKSSCRGINFIWAELGGIVSSYQYSYVEWNKGVGYGIRISDVELCGTDLFVAVEFKYT